MAKTEKIERVFDRPKRLVRCPNCGHLHRYGERVYRQSIRHSECPECGCRLVAPNEKDQAEAACR